MVDEQYAERIQKLFYGYSDEKPKVVKLLEEILGNRRFDSFLDVGCGPGEISGSFLSRSSQSTLLDLMPDYENVLRQKFPQADIVISSIEEFSLSNYDAILFSHNLYYHLEKEWFPLCERLFQALKKDGSFFVIMNVDRGDWWTMVKRFYQTYRSSVEFNYIPFSRFTKELEKLGPTTWTPYEYSVRFPDLDTLVKFIGEQGLQMRDQTVLENLRSDFVDLANGFERDDGGNYSLNFEAVIGEIRNSIKK